MLDTDKAKCFDALQSAAERLTGEEFEFLKSSQLVFSTLGVTLVMFLELPDGSVAHAEYLMAWEEIHLTKFDLLDKLVTDMSNAMWEKVK